MLGDLFRMMKPFAAPPPPGAQPPPLWGSEEHVKGLFGDRVQFHTLQRDVLEINAFARARDYGAHFKATTARRLRYAPTPPRMAARRSSMRPWTCSATHGTADGRAGQVEKEYLLAVGTRT
jgi:hypothetical protein